MQRLYNRISNLSSARCSLWDIKNSLEIELLLISMCVGLFIRLNGFSETRSFTILSYWKWSIKREWLWRTKLCEWIGGHIRVLVEEHHASLKGLQRVMATHVSRRGLGWEEWGCAGEVSERCPRTRGHIKVLGILWLGHNGITTLNNEIWNLLTHVRILTMHSVCL